MTRQSPIFRFWPPVSWINLCPFLRLYPISCLLFCKMGAFYIQEEQKFKYALHQQRINFLTYFVTHLLVSFIPVEPRLSLDLLELGLSSVSFFETSFLNGSFLALKTAMVKYKWHMPNIFLWIIDQLDQSKFKKNKQMTYPFNIYLLSMKLCTVKVGDTPCHLCTGRHCHQTITLWTRTASICDHLSAQNLLATNLFPMTLSLNLPWYLQTCWE